MSCSRKIRRINEDIEKLYDDFLKVKSKKSHFCLIMDDLNAKIGKYRKYQPIWYRPIKHERPKSPKLFELEKTTPHGYFFQKTYLIKVDMEKPRWNNKKITTFFNNKH